MSSPTSALRWVRYDGVFYAAILVPPSEAPVTVPADSNFVFFLDGESGALVSEADVQPFDPTDAEKAEHPAAVDGVRLANEILRGPAAASAEAGPFGGEAALDETDAWALEQLMDADLDDTAEDVERRQRRREEAQSRKEERAARKAERKLKKKREREVDSDEDADYSGSSHDDDDDEDASPRRTKSSATTKKANGASNQSHWAELAEMLEDDEGAAGNGGLLSGGVHNRRTVQVRGGGRGRDAFSSGVAALMDGSAPIAVYLAEIHHHYGALHEEAQARGMVLSATEHAVVTSIDAMVRRDLATVQYLERELDQLERQAAATAATTAHAPQGNSAEDAKASKAARRAAQAAVEKERATVEAAVERLSAGPNIEVLVKQLAQMQPAPDPTRTDAPRRRGVAPGSSTATFMDPGFALHLREVSSSAATPLPMTTDFAATLREQRVYRERVMNYRKGLGKAGLNAPVIQPLESWNRTRELMVLAPSAETQLVRPVGYVPRRYSTMGAKREAVALRRLSVGVPAGDSALHGSPTQTGGSMGPPSGHPSGSLAQNSFLASQQDLLSTYMSSTRRARLTVPAYYDFHALRPASTGAAAAQTQGQRGMLSSHGGAGGADGLGLGAQGEENHLVFRSTADAGLFMSQLDDDGEMASMAPVEVPQLAVNFDPRATFAVGAEEIQDEEQRAAQLAGRSQMYSNSVYLPSEESTWFDSVAPAPEDRSNVSRLRSRASSAGRESGAADRKDKTRHSDWRDSAKRVILERLTLYLKGLKGYPKVLTESSFKTVAKKLLERAVQAESLRSGTSMVLQVNNTAVEFTKQTAQQLKTSVDKYVKSHFIDQVSPLDQAAARAESNRGSQHSEENSPVYDN